MTTSFEVGASPAAETLRVQAARSPEAAIADLIEKMPITRIVVAHRPALIRRATRVLLVKERRITEVRLADDRVLDLQGAAA